LAAPNIVNEVIRHQTCVTRNLSGVSIPARTISAITTELYLESSALDNFDDHFHNSHQRVIVNRSINRNCEPSYTHFIVSKGRDEHEKLIKLRRATNGEFTTEEVASTPLYSRLGPRTACRRHRKSIFFGKDWEEPETVSDSELSNDLAPRRSSLRHNIHDRLALLERQVHQLQNQNMNLMCEIDRLKLNRPCSTSRPNKRRRNLVRRSQSSSNQDELSAVDPNLTTPYLVLHPIRS